MKVYVMTDMEGVCGVINHDDWVMPAGRYYEEGKRLLTREVNAAVEGFCAAGVTEVLVVDGHGAGGINHSMLDVRTRYARVQGFPFALDETFDAIAFVGQHAKAATEYAHIAHTGWFDVLDYRINDISIGEFGQMALIGAAWDIPVIFGSGDAAFCREAEALTPGIEAVAVKWGQTPGTGDECNCEAYRARNLSAIHLHPARACELIRDGAYRALTRLQQNREGFAFPPISPPFTARITYRASGDRPGYQAVSEDADIVTLFSKPATPLTA